MTEIENSETAHANNPLNTVSNHFLESELEGIKAKPHSNEAKILNGAHDTYVRFFSSIKMPHVGQNVHDKAVAIWKGETPIRFVTTIVITGSPTDDVEIQKTKAKQLYDLVAGTAHEFRIHTIGRELDEELEDLRLENAGNLEAATAIAKAYGLEEHIIETTEKNQEKLAKRQAELEAQRKPQKKWAFWKK